MNAWQGGPGREANEEEDRTCSCRSCFFCPVTPWCTSITTYLASVMLYNHSCHQCRLASPRGMRIQYINGRAHRVIEMESKVKMVRKGQVWMIE